MSDKTENIDVETKSATTVDGNVGIKAKQRYEKKRIKLTVSFNPDNNDDLVLVQYAQSLNFSVWAKMQLQKELASLKK